MWFNNVETKPGIGYPQKWEDQTIHNGGWSLKNGKLRLKAGERLHKFANIFHNPDLPTVDQYYEPWTYDYDKLISSPQKRNQPSIRPKSQITGDPIQIKWGPNWEDDLAGVSETGIHDVNFARLDHAIYLAFKHVFLFYLPRLCEHCLNPACVASCPSGALYKREEDGIVLVDQERCRGWRYCVSGCPYKKVYFNWKTGRSEKCIFCYPRIEAGMPTLCALTCVGRIRYVGMLLYDADKIHAAASSDPPASLYRAHLDILLDPNDPDIARTANAHGIPQSFIDAARQSPVFKLAKTWELALPLHPEFRTLPMVWYIPPLSPIAEHVEPSEQLDAVDRLRIPITYLANLLTAGDEGHIRRVLKRLVALRKYMRSIRVENSVDEDVLRQAGLTEETARAMYQLLAIAKYEERFVVPTRAIGSGMQTYCDQGAFGFS